MHTRKYHIKFVRILTNSICNCSGPTKCEKEHQIAESLQRQNPNRKVFIPNCNVAGGYERMQCDRSVGECWCVDKMGSEEQGTRVRGTKQHCDAPCKLKTILVLHIYLFFPRLPAPSLSKII